MSRKALAEAKTELERLRQAYKAKREANRELRGRARGAGGQQLAKIGGIGRALKAEVDRIEQEIATNRQLAKMVGAAAEGGSDG